MKSTRRELRITAMLLVATGLGLAALLADRIADAAAVVADALDDAADWGVQLLSDLEDDHEDQLRLEYQPVDWAVVDAWLDAPG